MTGFDWILIIVAVIWGLLNCLSVWVMVNDPMVKYGRARVELTWAFFAPLGLLLLVAYRVFG